jgi:ubiquinone/menaquinone biosynthesis C-methylase UbiE
MSLSPSAYARDAAEYDTRTAAYEQYRRMIVEELPLRRGDTVIDAGCGTGLCFELLQERIGPEGVLVGVDAAPDMLQLAAERVADAGWSNVVLTCAPLEEAELPQADHAVFCAVHDITQSRPAIENVLRHLRPGASVAAGGGKWGPVWAIGMNASVLALHAPYVRDFTGFDRPWARLAERLTDFDVREVAMGAGFIARGQVAQPPPR